jgi:hypothetical protein
MDGIGNLEENFLVIEESIRGERRKFQKIRFRYYNAGRKIGRTQDIFTGDGTG